MILNEVLGNLRDFNTSGKVVEKVEIEWFELEKRLLRKVTDRGTEIGIVTEGHRSFHHGDILYADEQKVIALELLPAEAIVLTPKTMREMAQVCYQLGNRHASIFLEENQVMVPFDPTIVELFNKMEIPVQIEKRRLEHVLQPASSHHH